MQNKYEYCYSFNYPDPDIIMISNGVSIAKTTNFFWKLKKQRLIEKKLIERFYAMKNIFQLAFHVIRLIIRSSPPQKGL